MNVEKKTITQSAARRMRAQLKAAEKRIETLEEERYRLFSRWHSDAPGGTHIASISLSCDNAAAVAIRTAKTLGHAVVATERAGKIEFLAMPTPAKR